MLSKSNFDHEGLESKRLMRESVRDAFAEWISLGGSRCAQRKKKVEIEERMGDLREEKSSINVPKNSSKKVNKY